jgi:hypothetical protein
VSAIAIIAWMKMAMDGVWNRGCTSAIARKKYPSRAIANGTRAPLITVPFMVTIIESAIAADTNAAPALPSANATAWDAGYAEFAMAAAGIAYCTAAFTEM